MISIPISRQPHESNEAIFLKSESVTTDGPPLATVEGAEQTYCTGCNEPMLPGKPHTWAECVASLRGQVKNHAFRASVFEQEAMGLKLELDGAAVPPDLTSDRVLTWLRGQAWDAHADGYAEKSAAFYDLVGALERVLGGEL